jgi:hypothetical protein
MQDAGFEEVDCAEKRYFQPLLMGRRPSGI